MSTFRKRLWQDRLFAIRHYTSFRFAWIDFLFSLTSLFSNPYRVCRKFLQKKREGSIYTYGETPLATYQRMAEQCQVGPRDVWVEMGAGRGKGCFWLAHFIGCRVRGVEWIPQFVYLARAVQFLSRMKNISFALQEMSRVELEGATIVYLYGEHPAIQIPAGVKVISISEPLPDLEVVKTFWVRYPWGRTTAFLQKRDLYGKTL